MKVHQAVGHAVRFLPPELDFSPLALSIASSENARLSEHALLDVNQRKIGLALAANGVSEESLVEVPYIPLSQIEPETMTYQQAMSSKFRGVGKCDEGGV